MLLLRYITKHLIVKFRNITKTVKSKGINLLTGKSIKVRKPKEKKVEQQSINIETSSIGEDVFGIAGIVETLPKEIQMFLNNTEIIGVKTSASRTVFKLKGKYELTTQKVLSNRKPKVLVILKQGKKELIKNIVE